MSDNPSPDARAEARELRILRDQCVGKDGGAAYFEEQAAQRLDAFARRERLEEHLELCPKCTRKSGQVLGTRCPRAVELERKP